MHVALTDILTCPRCGPEYGLVLLANRSVERRVLAGLLGCSNCREQYAVERGAARFGGRVELGAPLADPESALRLAALLGVARGPGFVLLAGEASAHAAAFGELIEDIEVVASGYGAHSAEASPDAAAVPELSRIGIGTGGRLPLATGKLLGAALTGAAAEAMLEKGARVVAMGRRLLLEPAPPDAAARVAAAGLKVLLHEGDTLIAVRG
jgi:uncharacterized protein YbaR (Trm112 family)